MNRSVSPNHSMVYCRSDHVTYIRVTLPARVLARFFSARSRAGKICPSHFFIGLCYGFSGNIVISSSDHSMVYRGYSHIFIGPYYGLSENFHFWRRTILWFIGEFSLLATDYTMVYRRIVCHKNSNRCGVVWQVALKFENVLKFMRT